MEQCQDDETNTYVKAVVNALSLGDDEILLAIAWATAEGRLYHIKYPQVLGIDVKYGTNSERRPLARGVGKTGNERNFTPVNSYMPSEQRYAYSWVTGEGIQGCLDADALLKTTVIPTDEDKDQIAAIDGVLKTPNSTLGKARLRLCKWHKVSLFEHSNIRILFVRKFDSDLLHGISSVLCCCMQVNRNFQLGAKTHKKTDLDGAFIEEMRDWFYDFTNYIEYGHEEKNHLAKMREIIAFERSQGRVSKPLLDYTLDFLTTKFQDRLPLLCQRHFKFTYCGHVADNCFTESENSSLARDPLGPKPSYRLHVSADAILQHTDERFC